jgi:tetratricopeptide (TPR) repeat protein
MELRDGNQLAEGEKTLESFQARFLPLSLIAMLSTLVVAAIHYCSRLMLPSRHVRWLISPGTATLGAVFLWLLLFANNLKALPLPIGFDWQAHLDYIGYIQENKALPLAEEGWEMHQPPLYYAISAGALGLFGLSPRDPSAYGVLRGITVAAGLAQIALIFGCLRSLFIAQARAQVVGLVLAAFLPAHLYLYQYVTNETLAGALGTAAIYLCLRILRQEHPSFVQHLLLGSCLGAAFLTKVTALLLLPPMVAILAGRLVVRRDMKFRSWLRLTVVILASVGISGWYYARVWIHFGTPLVGSYDQASGYAWWQDPGYSTLTHYLSWGRSLTHPFFSCFNGYADGLYSTLFGDGMWGGTVYRGIRPPWNYDLMAAGYLLALAPTALILIGVVAAVFRVWLRPTAEWCLMVALFLTFGAALVYHYLRFPYYGHTKAFYALMIMAPVCACGALGFDSLGKCLNVLQLLLAIALGVWAVAAFASFWVVRDSAQTETWLAEKYKTTGSEALAPQHYQKALQFDPNYLDARLGLADMLVRANRRHEAMDQLQRTIRDHPDSGEAHYRLASVLPQPRTTEALEHIRTAIQLAPDHHQAYRVLGTLLQRLGQTGAAVKACREQLGVAPTNWAAHNDLAVYLAAGGESGEAVTHYRRALSYRPDEPRLLCALAWILSTDQQSRCRSGAEGKIFAERACELTHWAEPLCLDALAAAHAELARYVDAERVLRTGIGLATASGQTQLAQDMNKRLELYRARKPYRESRHFADHHAYQ